MTTLSEPLFVTYVDNQLESFHGSERLDNLGVSNINNDIQWYLLEAAIFHIYHNPRVKLNFILY